MKKIFILILLGLCAHANAQINVGSNAIATMNKAGRLSEDDMNDLKKTTTLFTLQYRDYDVLRAYEKMIGEVWTITKFKIIKPDEMSQYLHKKGYSFFSFGGFYTTTARNGGPSRQLFSQHITYDLWTPDINKNGKLKENNYYSRIMLYPDAKVFEKAMVSYGSRLADKMENFFYNEAVFYNWGPGFLKGYLKTVNDVLTQQDTRGGFTSDEDDDALANLKKDTLYVPDYVNVTYNPFTGTDSAPDEDDKDDDKDANTSYPYHIKYITNTQLNDMLTERTDPFYYLVYVRSSTDKFVDVYRSDKGLIYSRYKAVSYNFKNKDLGKIAKAIR